MTKIYVKLYGGFVLSGSDFAPTLDQQLRRLVFAPDNIHSISVVPLHDGTLLITNESGIAFDFSISRNRRVLAVVRCRQNANSLAINNNWLLNQDGVQNRAISTNPDLVFSENLNIDFDAPATALARVDVKIEDSGFACAIFSERDLLFVRMNGNHAFPRLCEQVRNEAATLPITEERMLSYLRRNADFAAQLPVTEAQVSTFLANNPDFATNAHITDQQVLQFLNENPEFRNNIAQAAFAQLMQTTQWFSN